jgi:hypothetical protein
MPHASKPLEVFQDLHLLGPASAAQALHKALKAHADAPWRYAAEREENLRVMGDKIDALAFERAATPGFEAAGLVLLSNDDGMEVANIVPLTTSELSYRAYNAILVDFATCVARPAADEAGFCVKVSSGVMRLEDEIPANVSEALRRFSAIANRSTGAAHPRDQERWFDFIILAHREGARLDASTLARWLSESEGWPGDRARELAGDYENARSLLERFVASE